MEASYNSLLQGGGGKDDSKKFTIEIYDVLCMFYKWLQLKKIISSMMPFQTCIIMHSSVLLSFSQTSDLLFQFLGM